MGSCGTSCGINREREKELGLATQIAREIQRVRTRGQSDTCPRAVPYDALVSLALDLEGLLPVRAHVDTGASDDCDSLLLLAGLHAPALADLWLGAAKAEALRESREETYVRVAVSSVGRFVVLQEVRIASDPTPEGVVVTLTPQPGVVDRRLQNVIKGLQGHLRRARLVVLDLKATLQPLHAETSVERSTVDGDEEESLWSLLFEATSPMAQRARLVFRDDSSCGLAG